jgi:pimeloyl-ACP methyl ester carboxylesterase
MRANGTAPPPTPRERRASRQRIKRRRPLGQDRRGSKKVARTALDLPTYFFIGRFDVVCPWQLAEQYFRRLKAPRKRWVWFEQSAHFPFLEEPARFAEEMRNVRSEVF